MRQDILVSYDVNTQDTPGRARLRRMAKALKNFGQRVQDSVFECSVDDVGFERLRKKTVAIIDPEKDSLRIYRLGARREECVESFGLDKYFDFDEPMVV